MSDTVLPARICISVVREVSHYPVVDGTQCDLVFRRFPDSETR